MADYLHNKPRWTADDYAEALLILKGATIEGPGGKTYKVFKGLTNRAGFDPKKPEKITRAKRRTIKKLLGDLAAIRTRKTIPLAPRKSRRRFYAKKATGHRSPFMNVYPLPVLSTVRSQVKWLDDRPVVEYPQAKVKTMAVPVDKGRIKKAMMKSVAQEIDLDEAITDEMGRQVKKAIDIMRPHLKPGEVMRFRLRTIYGDLESGAGFGISEDYASLISQMTKFINEYFERDKKGNFFVGFTIWTADAEAYAAVSQSYKRAEDRAGVAVKPKTKAQSKRAIMKGRR